MTRLVLVGLALAGLLGCASASESPVLREVRIDDVPWQLIEATPDGMRGQPGFGEADGMLFDMGQEVDPDAVVFVMDGVAFPLDIAWFAEDGRLVSVADMPQCDTEPCPRFRAAGPFRWAVEAPPGAFDGLADDARLVIPG